MTTRSAPAGGLATPRVAPAAAPPGAPPAARADRRGDLALVAAMLLLYAPLIFLGYGADNDTYLVLDSGRELLERHTYTPSRNPGYFLFESAVGVLSRVGGSVLCNAVTLAAAAAAVLCFLGICRGLRVPRPRLLAALLVVHPVFWTNATCTMDYVWALALLLGGCLLLLRDAHLAAGVLLGLAVAVRSTSAVGAGLLLVCALAAQRGAWRRVLAAAAVAALIAAAFYVPPFRYAGHSLAFLRPMTGAAELWTPELRLARFAYKNVYFWGLPAALLLPALALLARRPRPGPSRRPLVLACAAIVAAYEALFLSFPIEPAYLLPLLPAVLILLGVGLSHSPPLLAALGAALASYAVVSVNVARPDRPERATGGEIGFWIEPGFVLGDARERVALRGCDTYACWKATTGQAGSP